MDVLSDVIAAMRTGRAHSNRTHKRGPWASRYEPVTGAGFHVVLQGSCWLISEQADPVPLGVGDVVCLLSHTTVYGLADAPSTPLREMPPVSLIKPTPGRDDPDQPVSTVLLCGAYLLDRSRPHPLLAELPEFIHLPARIGRHPSLRAAIDLLGTELERPRQGTDAVVPALLDMLLLFILRAWYDEQADHDSASGWAAALSDRAVSAALRAIHREPGRAWTVETLGAEAGLSRAAFARRFSALVGQPPLAYLTWWRLTTAARLLRDTDAPLGTVAARTGYTSEFAFAKAFKREYGTAPGGYRRQGGRGQ
jgi:AraC-like DNA-binding protein